MSEIDFALRAQIRKFQAQGLNAAEVAKLTKRSRRCVNENANAMGSPFPHTRGAKAGKSTGPLSEARKQAIREGVLRSKARREGAEA
jgi:hypothetical protein